MNLYAAACKRLRGLWVSLFQQMNRRSIQVFLTALASIFVLSLNVAAESQSPTKAEPDHAQQDYSKKQAQATDTIGVTPNPKTSAIAKDQQAQAAVYDPDCGKPADHDQADLCIQRQMTQSAQDALQWARWQTLIGAVGLVFVALSLGFAAWAARAAALAAQEASKGNLISANSFAVDQRAWLAIELQVQGNFVTAGGTAAIQVGARIKNIGKTPAKFIHTQMRMNCQPGLHKNQQELNEIAELELNRPDDYTRSLLPNQEYIRDWYVDDYLIDRDIDQGQVLMPRVFVCVTYESIFDDGFHQTAAVFVLGQKADDYRDDVGEDYLPIAYVTADIPAKDISVTPTAGSIIT